MCSPGIWKADGLVTAPAGTAIAGADPLLFVGKNLHVIGTKVGSLLDTEKALQFAARVCRVDFSFRRSLIEQYGAVTDVVSLRVCSNPSMRCFL